MQSLKSAFQGFDPNNLDFSTAGSWPIGVKVIVYLIAFGVVLFAGNHFYISDKASQLDRNIAQERTLKTEFQNKSFQVANLVTLRQQMADVEEEFAELLRQLPTQKEVPGLLEDISDIGRAAGLDIRLIELAPEKKDQFYIELPINIEVRGTYHQMGQFVSGIAAIKRIVTLHDFTIKPADANARQGNGGLTPTNDGPLEMAILAKTYRYDDTEK